MFELLNKEIFESVKLKYIVYPLVALLLLGMSKCTFNKAFKRVTINAGTVGVIVAKPYFMGSGGVTGDTMSPGAHWTWTSNEVNILNSMPQQVEEKFEDMYSSDNIPVDFEAYLNFQVINYVSFIKNWGTSWYAANIQQVFRTAVRDECKKYKMTELVSSGDVSQKVEDASLSVVKKYAEEKKIPIVFTKVNVGKINPNKDVSHEIAQTAVQQQRQRTEGERKKAEDMRRATETSRAAADNAYREAMNLAPEQYIRLEAVKAYSHAAEECAKNPDCTMILTQPGSGVGQNVDVGNKHKK